jgi:hypothetical protein
MRIEDYSSNSSVLQNLHFHPLLSPRSVMGVGGIERIHTSLDSRDIQAGDPTYLCGRVLRRDAHTAHDAHIRGGLYW